MEMAKASQSHGLEFTPNKQTAVIVLKIQTSIIMIININIDIIIVVVNKIVISRALNVITRISTNISICGIMIKLMPERADAELPVVVPILDLDVFHESPVVVSVASRELLEVLQSALQEFLAREVGGA